MSGQAAWCTHQRWTERSQHPFHETRRLIVNSADRRKFERAVKRETEKRSQDRIPSNHQGATSTQPETTLKSASTMTKFRQLGIRGWSLIVAFATIITIACGFLILRSDVTITPRVKLDLADPFSTLYTVTNEGIFPIKDVVFSCHMNEVEIQNYRFAVVNSDG